MHTQDIINYIESELKVNDTKLAEPLQAELQRKASGIFMWVFLVIRILNEESDGGRIHLLWEKLDEIPGDLHDLFHSILTRDLKNRDGLVLCIQWVLFAKQPLSPEQLRHAILSGTRTDALSEWASETISKSVVERFVIDSSKGLVEIVASKKQKVQLIHGSVREFSLKENGLSKTRPELDNFEAQSHDRKVQFIHESVRDFLLKENGLSKIWPEAGNNFQAQSHDRLKQCCLNQINTNVTPPLEIDGMLPKASSQRAEDMRKLAVRHFPFLEYAVRNVLYHADVAEECGISQAQFPDTLSLPQWVRLHNLFENYDVRRHNICTSLLYILAELNIANLIRIHPSIHFCLEVEDSRYGCAFLAANATGNKEAMQACIKGIKLNLSENRLCRRRHKDVPGDEEVKYALGRDFQYSKKRGLLSYAAQIGSVSAVAHLMESGKFDPNARDRDGRTPLWWAIETGNEAVATAFLTTGTAYVDLEYSDALFHTTVRTESNVPVEDASADAPVWSNGTALIHASARKYKKVVATLLKRGVNIHAQSNFYGDALPGLLLSLALKRS